MRYLRTNTAVRVTVGPFFGTDGLTPKTALTVTNEKLTFMVDDANVPTLVLDTAPTASGGANDMVHVTGDDAGFYDLELAAANVNYLGRAMLALTDATNHCPVFHEFMIIPANIYDSMILGTDLFDVSVTQWTGTSVASPDTAGYPKVTVKSGTGTGEVSLSSGAVIVQSGTGTGQIDFTSGVVKSNVTQYNGVAVTAASGRPEVNVSHFGGTAGTFSAGRPQVNASHIAGTLQVAPGTTGGITLVKFAGAATAVTSDSFTFSFTGDPTGASVWFTSTGAGSENRVIDEWDGVSVATVEPPFALTHSGTYAVELDSLGARVATQLENDVTAIKDKTDNMQFTVAGQIDANIQFVNDTQVTGAGTVGSPWGP